MASALFHELDVVPCLQIRSLVWEISNGSNQLQMNEKLEDVDDCMDSTPIFKSFCYLQQTREWIFPESICSLKHWNMFMWVMQTDLRSWLNMTQHFPCPHIINCAQIFLYQHPNYSTSSNIQTGITFTLGDRQREWYTLNDICGAPYIDISHSWH